MQLGEKIGWTGLDDHDQLDRSRLQFYDVTSQDAALFEAEIWAQLDKREPSMFRNVLLPLLAVDADTPAAVLVRIARDLYDSSSSHIAWNLLENPAIADHPDVLLLLACLPVFPGDDYKLPRNRARELLGAAFPGCP